IQKPPLPARSRRGRCWKVLSGPAGHLRYATADLETAQASRVTPHTHDLRRLLMVLEAEGVATAHHEPLAQLTVCAVQFRYDADPLPWGWIGRPSTGR
ncbi:MAG: hypothetical protein ACKOPS_20865, partial [Cyanobium sp.]